MRLNYILYLHELKISHSELSISIYHRLILPLKKKKETNNLKFSISITTPIVFRKLARISDDSTNSLAHLQHHFQGGKSARFTPVIHGGYSSREISFRERFQFLRLGPLRATSIAFIEPNFCPRYVSIYATIFLPSSPSRVQYMQIRRKQRQLPLVEIFILVRPSPSIRENLKQSGETDPSLSLSLSLCFERNSKKGIEKCHKSLVERVIPYIFFVRGCLFSTRDYRDISSS